VDEVDAHQAAHCCRLPGTEQTNRNTGKRVWACLWREQRKLVVQMQGWSDLRTPGRPVLVIHQDGAAFTW